MRAVRPEDAELARELGGHVNHLDADGWHSVIVALRDAGYDVVRKADSTGPDFSAAYLRVEPKVQALLARRAPPGTEVTRELISSVQSEIVALIVDELKHEGFSEQSAQVLGLMLSAAINLKEK